jgi:hypothetical protein
VDAGGGNYDTINLHINYLNAENFSSDKVPCVTIVAAWTHAG